MCTDYWYYVCVLTTGTTYIDILLRCMFCNAIFKKQYVSQLLIRHFIQSQQNRLIRQCIHPVLYILSTYTYFKCARVIIRERNSRDYVRYVSTHYHSRMQTLELYLPDTLNQCRKMSVKIQCKIITYVRGILPRVYSLGI